MSGRNEQLLGYLLGALEEEERREIDVQLHRDPALREELASLRRCLAPLEDSWQPVCPPAGLSQRTCRFVDVAARAVPGPLARSTWRVRDVVAAAAILLAIGLVALPVIKRSRFEAAVLGCQNNLRQIGISLKKFAEIHNGYFPHVPHEGNTSFAGFYAALLHDYGMLPDARVTLCPAVASQRQETIHIPSCETLRTANPVQLGELRRKMCGDYGYHLGVVVDGRYMAVRDLDRHTFAIAADSPSPWLDGEPSGNHGSDGQNVLFEDGSVQFFRWKNLTVPCVRGDWLFVNDFIEVAPGKHPGDAVIAPVNARPAAWGGRL